MASNFEITIDQTNDAVNMKLAGDFDATSAYELIYAIKKLSDAHLKFFIHTNDIKTVYPFGVTVFHSVMSTLNGQSTQIAFIGKNAQRLKNESYGKNIGR